MATKECVMLTSSMSSNADQKNQIAKTRQLLTGNKIHFTEIDCSMDENRATRDRYFEVSGVRGNFPQVFVQNLDGTNAKYVGSFKEIEELNELQDIAQAVIDANKLSNLNSVFEGVARHETQNGGLPLSK